MTSSPTFRPLSAALLAAALAFVALPGCGDKPVPTPADNKKDGPKPDPKPADKGEPKPADKGDTKTTPPPVGTEPKNLLGTVESDAEKTVDNFLKELGQGTATAGALSTNLLKAVGKPLELPADTAQGYSPDNATRWLRRVGEGRTFSLSLDRKQAGDAVYCRGALQGQPGGYALRLVKEGGAWKVDWLSLSSVSKGDPPAGTADEAFQEFAVRAFVEVMADGGAMSDDTRPPALAHALTAELRKAWAAPGAQDAAQGYDYSPGHLRLAAVKYAGGTKEFAVSKAGPQTFDVILTRPAGPKTLAVKLVKGTTPGEWLVSDVTEKG